MDALVRHCVKVLGPQAVHEADVEEEAWQHAGKTDGQNVDALVKSFTNALGALVAETHVRISPNYAIQFEGGIREITIGPVTARLSEDLVKTLGDLRLEVAIGSQPGVDFIQNKVTFAPTSWEVKVTSSKGNVEEEAMWLINIAISLLRLWPAPRKLPRNEVESVA